MELQSEALGYSPNGNLPSVKPLTRAQKAHLQKLLDRRQAAMQAAQEYINYLADEHDAPAIENWIINLDAGGFVQMAEAADS